MGIYNNEKTTKVKITFSGLEFTIEHHSKPDSYIVQCTGCKSGKNYWIVADSESDGTFFCQENLFNSDENWWNIIDIAKGLNLCAALQVMADYINYDKFVGDWPE